MNASVMALPLWRQQQFWVIVVLWLAVMASAVMVVYVSYDTRIKFNQLESLRGEQAQLQVIWGKFLLEESAWAVPARIEKLAQERLSMQVPESHSIVAVKPE